MSGKRNHHQLLWEFKKTKTEPLGMPGKLGSFREEGAFELGFKARIEVYCLRRGTGKSVKH